MSYQNEISLEICENFDKHMQIFFNAFSRPFFDFGKMQCNLFI